MLATWAIAGVQILRSEEGKMRPKKLKQEMKKEEQWHIWKSDLAKWIFNFDIDSQEFNGFIQIYEQIETVCWIIIC